MADRLTLEQYATAVGHVQHFGRDRADEVRQRLGLDDGVWRSSEAHWSGVLAEESFEDESPSTESFLGTVAETQTQLGREGTEIESLQPMVEEGGDSGEVDDSAGTDEVDEGEVAPSSHTLASEEPVSSTSTAPSVGGVSPPVAVGASRSGPSPWTQATPPAAAPSPDATAFVATVMTDAPLPFAPGGDQPPVQIGELPAHPQTGMTQEVRVPAQVVGKQAAGAVDMTAAVAVLRIDDPLPFEAGPAAPPPSAVSGSHAEVGMTAEVATLDPGDATPFSSDAEPVEPWMPLEQYASLRAELTVHPSGRAVVLERYRLDERALRRLDDAFAKLFERVPGERVRLGKLEARYVAWLQSRE